MTRPLRRLAAALAIAAAVVAVSAPSASADQARSERVLLIAYPRVTWALVEQVRPPRLLELMAAGAVGSLSVQTAAERTDAADGYLTIGASDRAEMDGTPDVTPVAGGVQVALARDGRLAGRGPYDAEPGALGTALVAGGHPSAVIADTPSPALAMVDETGRAEGTIGGSLGVIDPTAPGGRRLDPTSVLAAFETVWRPGAAVLVEQSDLERARTPAERAAALQSADTVLDLLLAQVDPGRDLVLVVAPVAPGDRAELTVFAAAGPGFDAERARSATTRRAGYVTLPDIAPTVLGALGIAVPDNMAGTTVSAVDGPAVDPADLAEAAARSTFRERTVGPVTGAFLGLQLLVYAVVGVAFHRRGARKALRAGLLAVLAFPVLAFLSGLVDYDELGLVGYVIALVLGALVIGLGVTWLRAAHPLAPPLALVAFTWMVLIVDAIGGSALQLDTPFGYSPITAARFAGMGNLGFALVMVSAIVLATGAWPAWPGVGLAPEPLPAVAPRPILALAATLFAVTFVADGAPFWGADVGGVIAIVPALAITWLGVAGRRIGWRQVLTFVVVALAAVLVFAAVDLARPEDQRTHVGRFARRALDGDAWPTLARKVETNLHVLLHPGVVFAIVVAAVALILVWRRSTPFRAVRGRVPGVAPALRGALVGGVLGFSVNDSGIVVPGMMLAVLAPWICWLALDLAERRERAAGVGVAGLAADTSPLAP